MIKGSKGIMSLFDRLAAQAHKSEINIEILK